MAKDDDDWLFVDFGVELLVEGLSETNFSITVVDDCSISTSGASDVIMNSCSLMVSG
jgi:hypothetical protein